MALPLIFGVYLVTSTGFFNFSKLLDFVLSTSVSIYFSGRLQISGCFVFYKPRFAKKSYKDELVAGRVEEERNCSLK